VALPLDESVYEGVERIQILACGTSRHAAQVGAYLLEQLAGIPTSVFYASEFRYAPPPLGPIGLACQAWVYRWSMPREPTVGPSARLHSS